LDPTNPTEAGFIITPSTASDVAVAGNYAYVANLDDGLRIIDISDPVNPREIGFHKSIGVVRSVTILGTHAYICAREAGLRIIDISDPANPNESSFYDTPGLASSVALAGKYVYIADYERGLRIIDISDPANLGEVGFYETRGSPEELVREENTMLTIFTFAGAIATLLLHGLSWHTRLNHLSIAVRLGMIGAIGTILYSGFIVFSYFLGPSGGADAFEFMRYVFIAFWLLSLLAVLLIGLLQARSLPVPGWKGVLSAFYEIGLGFLAVTGLNYALQYLIRTPEGMSDRVYLARFTITLVIGLVALALIRPFARLYRFRDRSNS
jgi:hypothetical protein